MLRLRLAQHTQRLLRYTTSIALALNGLVAVAQSGAPVSFEVESAMAIPGPRDCFWLRGPFGADPYVNIAYPDANVYYWAAVFTIPEGARLELHGQYPHSRYMSFASYDERGRPQHSLPDFMISSEQGSNPFQFASARSSAERSYVIRVVGAETMLLQQREVGSRQSSGAKNVLYAPYYGKGRQQTILYRIYLPDLGMEPHGGVALPKPVMHLADGRTVSGPEACRALRTRQPAALAPDAAGISAGVYRDLISQPDKPDTWPAQNPATWHIQLDRPSLLGIYTGEINEQARRSEGGFYPNPDNYYIRTIVNRRHGPVFLIRAKAPSTPKTVSGEPEMSDGNLRYWSICSNQSFVNTRVNDCLYDEEIPVDPLGYFTVVVSRLEDRPRNARKECGIGWLPMAPDGDGMFDKDVTIVQLRHMLPAADFTNSIDRVETQDQMEATLGEYMPKTRYLQTNQVEAFFPCLN